MNILSELEKPHSNVGNNNNNNDNNDDDDGDEDYDEDDGIDISKSQKELPDLTVKWDNIGLPFAVLWVVRNL